MNEDCNPDKTLISVGGFECSADTSKVAKVVLEKLSEYGFVAFRHDDGPTLLVRDELKQISHDIGLVCVETSPYELLLFDTEQHELIVEGSDFGEEDCPPID